MRCWAVWTLLLGCLWSLPAVAVPEAWPDRPSETLANPAGCLDTCFIDGKARYPRPDSLTPLWRDTVHFRVHYAVSGTDSISATAGLAYIDSLASALERAYVCFRDTLDLPVALPDGTRGGGEDLIDCYVRWSPNGYLGEASADTCLEGGSCLRCAGYVSVRNKTGWSSLRRTAAHEYFHLVEYALDPMKSSWIKESSAAWSEKIVFPWDDGYAGHMIEWFSAPYLSLWATDAWHEYGTVQYWVFLEETQGRSFLPDLWKRSCEADGLTVLGEMLTARGSSLNQSLIQDALWCNATGAHDDGHHFRNGPAYPTIECQAYHRDYPVEAATLTAGYLARAAGSNYMRFMGPGHRDSLRVRIDGGPHLRDHRVYSLVITRDGTKHTESTVPPDAEGDATFLVPDWPGCDYVTLIVTNFREAGGDLSFRYEAQEIGHPTPLVVSDLTCTPNPFRESTEIRFSVRGLPHPASVTVFDLSGRRVRDLPVGRNPWGEYVAFWKVSDGRVEPLPRGCYFVRATFGSASATTKVLYCR